MAISTAAKGEFGGASRLKGSGFRRYMLLRAHPVWIILDLVGFIWATYFFWQHAWQFSLLILVVERGIGWILLQSADHEAIAKTLLGKLALLHLEPWNLFVQITGLLIAAWGVWEHADILILSGLSLIILGHLAGWFEVHPAFKWRENHKKANIPLVRRI